MHKTLIRSFPRARRTKLIMFFVFITMSSVPFQALKTNSLIAFDLFELVVAGLLKIVGFAQTLGLSFPNASLSLAKISGSFHTIILSITFRAHFFVPIEEKAVSLRLVICPPGRRSAAAAPAARQPTLPRPPTLKAVKPGGAGELHHPACWSMMPARPAGKGLHSGSRCKAVSPIPATMYPRRERNSVSDVPWRLTSGAFSIHWCQ